MLGIGLYEREGEDVCYLECVVVRESSFSAEGHQGSDRPSNTIIP